MTDSMSETKGTARRACGLRLWCLRMLLAGMTGVVVLGIGEVALRVLGRRAGGGGRLDPGMFLYSRERGWRLTPGWTGQHRHRDFDVTYGINRHGFRGRFPPRPIGGKRVAVVGDSFTFGFGVTNGATFVDRLNETAGDRFACMNFGVPGYSTDQEFLLVKDRVWAFEPDVVVLVVYLANDIIDNPREWPLQGNRAKPRFFAEGEGLVLTNVPVPNVPRPGRVPAWSLSDEVYGRRPVGWGTRQLMRSVLVSRLHNLLGGEQVFDADEVSPMFRSAIDLFEVIAGGLASACEEREVTFCLALLPGKSYVLQPESFSAAMQEYLREEIANWGTREGIPVCDLAGGFRGLPGAQRREMYFVYDGHLTESGHGIATELLSPLLL